jgi:plastocyanin
VLIAATDISAFHVVGVILALWAVIVAALGIMRHDFPGPGAEKIVMAISGILVLGAVGTAVTTPQEHPKGEKIENLKNKGGKEGSEAPDKGGTPAPSTGTESGQEEAGETGQDAPAQKTTQTINLTVPDGVGLEFDKDALTAQAGNVTLVAQNNQPIPHNVAIEGGGIDEKGPVVRKGGASEVKADLKAGEYTFYCSVVGHREGGMLGTLTVE